MSDAWTDDYNDDAGPQDQGNNTIKTLRALHDADSQRIKELENKLNAMAETQKANVVDGVLKSAGLDPAVGKFYSGEADPAAVAAWVEENKGLFGGAAAPVDDAPSVSPIQTDQQQTDYQRVLDAGVDGAKPGHYQDAMAALMSATTREELSEVYRRFG